MSTISVIIPVFNVEDYLSRCVDSVVKQSFTDFECVLTDDGATDRCAEICDEYALSDDRIIVIHQKNSGLSAARNSGLDIIEQSDSKWVSFVDSDDWIHRKYLESLLSACLLYKTSISACGFLRTEKEQIEDCFIEKQTQIWNVQELWIDDSVGLLGAWAKLYQKTMFHGIRFPVGKINEDRFTTHRLVFQQDLISYVGEKLYYYYCRSNSIMNSPWSLKRLDNIEACKEQIAFFESKKLILARNKAINDYFYNIKEAIRNLLQFQKDKTEYQHVLVLLRKELRCYLKKYKKELGLHINTNEILFYYAYPIEMGIAIKIRNLFGHKKIEC